MNQLLILVLLWPSISSHRLPAVALGSQSELFRVAEVPDTQTVGVFLEWIFAHPIGFLTYLALAMFSTALAPYAWLFPGVLPEVPRFETYMIAYPGMWMWYLLIPFSLLGLREAVRRSKGEAWPLIFYAASVFLIVSLFIPREARHRDMIMPIALLLAAVGLVYCRRWWILGLVVWTPLVGFAAWKLHSIGPILLAAVAAGAAVLSARYVRMHRLRAARLVRIE